MTAPTRFSLRDRSDKRTALAGVHGQWFLHDVLSRFHCGFCLLVVHVIWRANVDGPYTRIAAELLKRRVGVFKLEFAGGLLRTSSASCREFHAPEWPSDAELQGVPFLRNRGR